MDIAPFRALVGVGVLGLAACMAKPDPATSKTAPAAASKPSSQPGSQPGSATSLPSSHSTSTVAVPLDALFRMPETPTDVVLEVGDETATRADLEAQLRQTQVQLQATGLPPGLSRTEVIRGVVDGLIEDRARAVLAKRLGVAIDPERVAAWLAQIERRMEAEPAFAAFLLQAGKDAAQRNKDAVRAVQMEAIRAAIRDEVKAETRTAARRYYDGHLDDFKERGGTEAWRIFVKAPRGMVQRDRDLARSRAEQIHAKAKKDPGDFDNLAISFSEGGKGHDGGYIGWVSPGTLAQSLEAQLFSAEPNTILPLYEDATGFWVYKVGRSRTTRTLPFEEVADRIMNQLFRVTIRKNMDEKLEALKDELEVKVLIPEHAALKAPVPEAP